MTKENYRGYEVTLSDMDTKKCEGWKTHHWRCIVYNKAERKQMGFDVFGASLVTDMKPLEALHLYFSDAYTYMSSYLEDFISEFGYDYKESKKIWNSLESAYFKLRKFGYTDDDIENDYHELDEEWG